VKSSQRDMSGLKTKDKNLGGTGGETKGEEKGNRGFPDRKEQKSRN